MENNKKHVPDYEISTYSKGEFTYSGNVKTSVDAMKDIFNETHNHDKNKKGGKDEQNHRDNK